MDGLEHEAVVDVGDHVQVRTCSGTGGKKRANFDLIFNHLQIFEEGNNFEINI